MALGSFAGGAALMLIMSLGQAASTKVLATVRQLFGGSSIIVVAGGSQLLGGPRPDTARLTIDDIRWIAAEVPEIVAWDPQQTMPRAAVRHGDRTASARVLGQSERSREVWNRDVARGEYFDAQAVSSSARVALIGDSLAAALFGSDDPVGSDVLVGSVPFRVTGVLEHFGTDIHGMDRDNELVVPITTLQRRVLNVDTIVSAKLLTADASEVKGAATAVEQALRTRHGLTTGAPDDFSMITAVEVQQMLGFVQRILFLYLPLVALVSLVAGGVVAAVLTLSAVSQRVPEIGLRRAVGATPEDIRRQFLAETALALTAGGIAGVLCGYALCAVVGLHVHLQATFSWPAAIATVILSLVVGLVAGVLPARRAAALDPAEALR